MTAKKIPAPPSDLEEQTREIAVRALELADDDPHKALVMVSRDLVVASNLVKAFREKGSGGNVPN